jgi:hypothetical protein
MQLLFFRQQIVDRLPIHFIGNAAVNGTDGRTLGLFVKTLTFRAFVGSDIIRVYADGSVTLRSVYDGAVEQCKGTFYAGTIRERPLYAAFVDGIIGALRFAGAAIDAFFSYLNSHFLKIGGD